MMVTDARVETADLKKDSIGTAHVVFFVVAAAAPLTAVVGATPAAFAFGNGQGVPGAFVIAGLLYLLFSVGFTAMSRYISSAGAFYAYITQGLGRPFGVAGALIAILAYNAVQIAIYALFAVFLSQALGQFGIAAPWWLWALAAVVLVTVCGQRNVAFSGNLLGFFMLAEIAILMLLDVAIIAHGGGPEGLSLSCLSPAHVFVPGLGVSLVFVVGSFIGFEATAIFSEEARDPARTIARATYAALLLITGFYTFSTWAITQAYGPSMVASAAKANLDTFYFAKATALLGGWAAQLMTALLITSLFACVLSFHNTLNRYFFALGRERLAWRGLGAVHPRHQSPAVAGLVQSTIAAVSIIGFALGRQDPYAVVFSWMAALSVIAILALQILVCLAVIAFFRRSPHGLGLWTRVIAPIASLLGLGGGLYLVITNLSLLSGSDSAIVTAFPILVLATGVLGAVIALRLRTSDPAVYAGLGRAFD